MKKPKNDQEYIQQLERRIRRLENALLPWQLHVGAYGDLVADNLDSGRRVVIARRATNPQNTGQ